MPAPHHRFLIYFYRSGWINEKILVAAVYRCYSRRMKSNTTKLMTAAAIMLITSFASAQDRYDFQLSPNLGNAKQETEYAVTSSFDEHIAHQGAEMRMTEHKFRLSFPLKQDENNEWLLHTGLTAIEVDSNARFPDTWRKFPDRLWDIRLGTTYRHRFDNGWIGGGNITIASPSDRPFAGHEEVMVAATGFLRIPDGERNSWYFFLNYAKDREFASNIPLPGVAYNYRPNEQLDLLAGLPMSRVEWKPIDKLTMQASYFVPRNISAKVGYDIFESMQLYTRFDWFNKRFFHHDRQDDDDRLIYYEKRVVLGLHWDIQENIYMDLFGGWAFDRFWYEGEDYGDRGDNRLDMADGPIVKLQLGFGI